MTANAHSIYIVLDFKILIVTSGPLIIPPYCADDQTFEGNGWIEPEI